MSPTPVMRLLADGVPVALLCDLVAAGDPDSAAIYARERPTAEVIRGLAPIRRSPECEATGRFGARAGMPRP